MKTTEEKQVNMRIGTSEGVAITCNLEAGHISGCTYCDTTIYFNGVSWVHVDGTRPCNQLHKFDRSRPLEVKRVPKSAPETKGWRAFLGLRKKVIVNIPSALKCETCGIVVRATGFKQHEDEYDWKKPLPIFPWEKIGGVEIGWARCGVATPPHTKDE